MVDSPPDPPRYPFSAVVGADDVKLALLLAAVDSGIGGVLLRGEKGSAKSTLARGLAALLPGAAPFVDLPVGASEDRLVGSLDLAAALTGGEVRLRPGLLADAHGGVLYIDEVNLLADHLIDALLDVAASGTNRVEREGIAAAHPARFVLIGSMNPEEGELRPQFLDRFGLAVDVAAPREPADRGEAVRRRLGFDKDPAAVTKAWSAVDDEVATRLQRCVTTGPAVLPSALVDGVSALCVAVGVEGLRADLVICRAAAALARWEGREQAIEDDVRRVAPLALAHRARRNPFDVHGIAHDRLGDALDEAFAGVRPADARADDGDGHGGGGEDGGSGQPGCSREAGRLGELGAHGELGERGELGGHGELGGSRTGDGHGDPVADVDADDPELDQDQPCQRPGLPVPADDGAARGRGERPPASRPIADPGSVTPVARLDAGGGVRSRPEPQATAGRREMARGPVGRLVGDRQPGPDGPASVAVVATVASAAARHANDSMPLDMRSADAGPHSADAWPRGADEGLVVAASDVREAVRAQRTANLVVLAVDASGSMGAESRMEAAKGAVLALLVDAYQHRDRVALVTFGGEVAHVALRPTGSIEVARARLAALPTGGRTPLAAGIEAALGVASPRAGRPAMVGHRPFIVLVTDGRATSATDADDPLTAALSAARHVRERGVAAVVVDVEEGAARLGLAAVVASEMGARLVTVPELTGGRLSGAVRTALGQQGA